MYSEGNPVQGIYREYSCLFFDGALDQVFAVMARNTSYFCTYNPIYGMYNAIEITN
jgi:hypothetical protein